MRKAFVLATVLLSLGCVALVATQVMHWYVGVLRREGIESVVIVQDPDKDDEVDKEKWLAYNDHDPPYYYTYYLWHLTNPNATLAGEKPIYEEEDQEEFTQSKHTYYTFDAERSNGLSEDIQVTNVNAAYLTLIQGAGGERNLRTGIESGVFDAFNQLLTTQFAVGYLSTFFALTVPLERDQLIANVTQSLNVSNNEAVSIFSTQWANATTPLDEHWNGWLISDANGGVPSGMSLHSCIQLWNASLTGSLVNADPTSLVVLASAIDGDADAMAFMRSTFGLTTDQLGAVLTWFYDRLENWILPQLSVPGVCPDCVVISDLGYQQWGAANLLPDGVKELDPSITTDPEYALWAQHQGHNYTLTLNQSKAILGGTWAWSDPLNLGAFMQLVQSGPTSEPVLQQRWGVSFAEAQTLMGYIAYIDNAYVTPVVQLSPLVDTRTAYEWIWYYEDPLIAALGLPPQNVAYGRNDTTSLPSTFKTGYGHIDDSMLYVVWENQTEVNVWADTVNVHGKDGAQFTPNFKKTDTPIVWTPQALRPLSFSFDQDTQLLGVSLMRFALASEVFDASELYYQAPPFLGFANMTSSNQGVPMFLSEPHFYQVQDPVWLTRVEGLHPNRSAHAAVIDIEPYTGAVFSGRKRLQLATYVSPDSPVLDVSVSLWRDCMYPLFWAEESSELTTDLASDFKNAVYRANDIQLGLRIGGLTVSLLLIVCGVVCISLGMRDRSRYERLEDRDAIGFDA